MAKMKVRLVDKTIITGLIDVNEYRNGADSTIEVRNVILDGNQIEHILVNKCNIVWVAPVI